MNQLVQLPQHRKAAARRARFALTKVALQGLFSTDVPVLVQMVPVRRCNLACTYCNEYDDFSPHVPTETMFARIDHLSTLSARVVSFSGGEPMLHPDLDALIRRVREGGMIPELLTNGYLLTEKRIKELNDAGLNRLQISIDNVTPDDVSKKSLKVLDKKLALLAAHAEFDVNINSVIGGGVANPHDALAVSKRAHALGLSSTVGIIHDGSGQLKPLPDADREVYVEMKRLGLVSFGPLMRFKDNLVDGKPNDWKCRAGARYLYICEDGLVHYCSQQRGSPGIPLLEYTKADIRREFNTEKSCAPMCTVGCVHSISPLDNWRGRQTEAAVFNPVPDNLVQIGAMKERVSA
ncbi:radical SAM protein [Myxococcota bacterium]|nr:radical SAM protein [Myxococcota bacterium]